MKIGVPKESCPTERRVALDPPGVKRLREMGHEVLIEETAGTSAGFTDDAYLQAGATMVAERTQVFAAGVVIQVRAAGACPANAAEDLPRYRDGQLSLGLWDPLGSPQIVAQVARQGTICAALEMVPRITRAQSMDVLSSMATLAGYRAVIMAANELPKIFPLLMTAAGTLLPARVFVIGAGVAGLQAMATARRLGALVEGYDVRPAAREQVESVGARFVDLGLDTRDAEAAGGYAQALGDRFYAAQQAALARHVAESDIVICTAAVPGQKSPLLVSEGAVRGMRPGSIIVDLAAERGGNCECTRPDQNVVAHGVTILGPTNAPADLPFHASQMFSRNVLAFLQVLIKDNALNLSPEDEILRETIVARDGKVVHAKVLELLTASDA